MRGRHGAWLTAYPYSVSLNREATNALNLHMLAMVGNVEG